MTKTIVAQGCATSGYPRQIVDHLSTTEPFVGFEVPKLLLNACLNYNLPNTICISKNSFNLNLLHFIKNFPQKSNQKHSNPYKSAEVNMVDYILNVVAAKIDKISSLTNTQLFWQLD